MSHIFSPTEDMMVESPEHLPPAAARTARFAPKVTEPPSLISSPIISSFVTPKLSNYIGKNSRFADPVVYGDYPKIMRSTVGNRLPQFTKEQKEMLKGSYDFLGINYYTGNYAAHRSSPNGILSSSTDNMAHLSTDRNGVPIGKPTGVSIFFSYPKGLYNLLVYTKEKYNDPKIFITENGYGSLDNGTIKDGINDPQRVDFYRRHFLAVREAISQGVNVQGFFGWTFLDTFEWGSGYTLRFGFYYVDFKNGLKRIPKRTAIWFRNFLGKN